ncbi:MAG: ATP-binding cassette domain-containing protein, partial [Eubacteriales bacterium]
MYSITIKAGQNKHGQPESFEEIFLESGTLLAVVGNTGAGKSRLIQDIEQLVRGNSISKRTVILRNAEGQDLQGENLLAHLGQSMRFMLDTTVADFISLHNRCRGRKVPVEEVISLANTIALEEITPEMHLNLLSGGQTRGLMIADIALICDSPIVLIDEIENAGIDKVKGFQALLQKEKLLIIVTHDPHTALMASQRIVQIG